MVSIDDLYEVVHGLFKEPIIGPLKSQMAKICHLENRHDVIFSAESGPISIKFRRLVPNDMSTAVMWSKSKPEWCRIPIWRTFGRIPLHVIPKPPATLQDAATWRNQCHDRATLQGVIITSAILKIVFRHILLFLFFNAVWALTSGGFRIVSDTLISFSPSIGNNVTITTGYAGCALHCIHFLVYLFLFIYMY